MASMNTKYSIYFCTYVSIVFVCTPYAHSREVWVCDRELFSWKLHMCVQSLGWSLKCMWMVPVSFTGLPFIWFNNISTVLHVRLLISHVIWLNSKSDGIHVHCYRHCTCHCMYCMSHVCACDNSQAKEQSTTEVRVYLIKTSEAQHYNSTTNSWLATLRLHQGSKTTIYQPSKAHTIRYPWIDGDEDEGERAMKRLNNYDDNTTICLCVEAYHFSQSSVDI